MAIEKGVQTAANYFVCFSVDLAGGVPATGMDTDVSLKPCPYRSRKSGMGLSSAPTFGTDVVSTREGEPSLPLFRMLMLVMSRDICWTETSLR